MVPDSTLCYVRVGCMCLLRWSDLFKVTSPERASLGFRPRLADLMINEITFQRCPCDRQADVPLTFPSKSLHSLIHCALLGLHIIIVFVIMCIMCLDMVMGILEPVSRLEDNFEELQ